MSEYYGDEDEIYETERELKECKFLEQENEE